MDVYRFENNHANFKMTAKRVIPGSAGQATKVAPTADKPLACPNCGPQTVRRETGYRVDSGRHQMLFFVFCIVDVLTLS